MTTFIQISTVSFEPLPGMVFVRVPNERGRWMLTHKCVVTRACPVCHSTVGEPCKSRMNGKYWVGTHADRRGWSHRMQAVKARIRPSDIEEANEIIEDDEP